MSEITRRDYFAAHAPPVPDDFELADPIPDPPVPASVADCDALAERGRRELGVCPGGRAEADAWHARRSAHVEALNAAAERMAADRHAWAAENRRVARENALAREVAWRWHWADRMLAAGK